MTELGARRITGRRPRGAWPRGGLRERDSAVVRAAHRSCSCTGSLEAGSSWRCPGCRVRARRRPIGCTWRQGSRPRSAAAPGQVEHSRL